jgi:flagellar biosynthesis/type III secretory pathway protein FliH
MANIVLKLAKPLKTVKICDNCISQGQSMSNDEQLEAMEDLKIQKALYAQACQAIQAVADKFKETFESIFAQRNEEIAKLSVEIARKVLMRSVEEGDYKIESIISEIIKNAPAQNDLVVHLNPKDLSDIQKIGQEVFSGVTFVPDNNIGPAECMLETPKGIIKSLIDEHLEQIGRALKKAG